MSDIDHFKNINDEFGQGVGDEVSRTLVLDLSKKFRTGDLFARLGGEQAKYLGRNRVERAS